MPRSMQADIAAAIASSRRVDLLVGQRGALVGAGDVGDGQALALGDGEQLRRPQLIIDRARPRRPRAARCARPPPRRRPRRRRPNKRLRCRARAPPASKAVKRMPFEWCGSRSRWRKRRSRASSKAISRVAAEREPAGLADRARRSRRPRRGRSGRAARPTGRAGRRGRWRGPCRSARASRRGRPATRVGRVEQRLFAPASRQSGRRPSSAPSCASSTGRPRS